MKYLYPFIILVGILLGWFLPFYALSLSRWAFVFLLILLTLNLLPIEFNMKAVMNMNRKDLYFIFFSYFFLPALVFIISLIAQINHSFMLGFFMTSLAPLAIITPQFLTSDKDKLSAFKHILLSNFLFPLYFSVMLFLFFPKIVKFNIFSIIQDSLILTILPVILVLAINSFLSLPKKQYRNTLKKFLPVLNMLILGILCFIFVGSSYLKNDLTRITPTDWTAVIVLAIFQDFGVYALAVFFKLDKASCIILSMKNVAFIGTFALIFFPKALLPVVAVLFIHVFLILFHSINFQEKFRSANKSN